MDKLVIEAGRVERQYWRDLWKYRELFYFLAWRDLLVRYKQTAVGVVWSLLKPLVTVFVSTLVFGKFANVSTGGVPYPLMALCGMLPWQFFSAALSESGNSLVNNSNLISKVYFPRMIVPASSVITSFVDFFISAVLLVILLFWYRFLPPIQIAVLPFFILLAIAASLGAGLWFAALMVEYRDFRIIVPFIVQFGFFATPVAYAPFLEHKIRGQFGLSPEQLHLLYSLNPLVGIIDGFRWCILGGQHTLYLPGQILSIVEITLLLVSGVWYFRRTERVFADVI